MATERTWWRPVLSPRLRTERLVRRVRCAREAQPASPTSLMPSRHSASSRVARLRHRRLPALSSCACTHAELGAMTANRVAAAHMLHAIIAIALQRWR